MHYLQQKAEQGLVNTKVIAAPHENRKAHKRLEVQARNLKMRRVFIAVIMANRFRRIGNRSGYDDEFIQVAADGYKSAKIINEINVSSEVKMRIESLLC